MKVDPEPKNSENISLMQMKDDEQPPPISRENKPRLPPLPNGSVKSKDKCTKIKNSYKAAKLKNIKKNNNESSNERTLCDNEATFQLFNMSKESIV